MPKIIEMIGKTFGRLTVVSLQDTRCANGARVWICRCSCGKNTAVLGCHLRDGHTRSCGCLQEEVAKELAYDLHRITLRHGESFDGPRPSKEYNTWHMMQQRCTNPNAINYSYYGGRGITICERWFNSFENFLIDVGRAPSPKHSIDRIDVNGNYEPGNVQWTTASWQAKNRRRYIYGL